MIPEEQILDAKILIIDDNILNVQILKRILTDAGYAQLKTTTDPAQALGLYQEFRPDLVLIDFNMPGLTGIDVMRQFAASDPGGYLPVLMLSGEEDPGLRVEALKSGAKDFLKKPYERLEVLVRSRNIIEVRLLYNQMKHQNRSLEDNVRERTNDLRQTRIDVVQRLARVAEYRDKETGQHIVRMSRYAEALSRAAGLSPGQCDLILTVSPLHDIGKVAIPDNILLKPGKLDPAEFELIKTHTTVGAQMLEGADSAFLRMARTIALTHHERFDGSGYPQGLKGEDIPLVGRICAVCDVFDALSSVRPYKQAWTLEESFAEIKKGAGCHFDPRLVEAFLAIEADIVRIHGHYQ